jgi:hypothetical protein
VHHWLRPRPAKTDHFLVGVNIQAEESFLDLRQSGVLTLNAKAVAKEQADVIAQRHDELIAARKEGEFDEAAAYAMPFDQLEKKARGF